MKNTEMKRYLYSAMLVCCMGMLPACNDDPETDGAYVRPDAEELAVNKRGLTAEGETPAIGVRSNTYWVIRRQETDDWLTLSPAAGSGDVEVEIDAAENSGEPRSAALVFETRTGEIARFVVRQQGSGHTVDFFGDDFGTGASDLSIARFDGWNRRGIGSRRCQYAGDNVRVDSGAPSSGYEGASGGNNIRFGAADADFVLGGIDLKGDINFRLVFGCMTGDASFDAEKLRLYVSKDQQHWTPLSYERSQASGWESVEVPFYLPEGVRQLYFRFRGADAENYRLDDIALTEGDGSGTTVTFVEDVIEYETYTIFDENFDWCVGKAGEDNNTLPGSDNGGPAYQNGWSGTRVYQHPGFAKISTASNRGWLTSPAMEAIGEKRVTVTMTFRVGIMNSDLGRFMIKVHNGGTIDDRTEAVYDITTDNTWESMTVFIAGATKETKVEFTGVQNKSNRFYIDDVRATYVDVKEE